MCPTKNAQLFSDRIPRLRPAGLSSRQGGSKSKTFNRYNDVHDTIDKSKNKLPLKGLYREAEFFDSLRNAENELINSHVFGNSYGLLMSDFWKAATDRKL